MECYPRQQVVGLLPCMILDGRLCPIQTGGWHRIVCLVMLHSTPLSTKEVHSRSNQGCSMQILVNNLNLCPNMLDE